MSTFQTHSATAATKTTVHTPMIYTPFPVKGSLCANRCVTYQPGIPQPHADHTSFKRSLGTLQQTLGDGNTTSKSDKSGAKYTPIKKRKSEEEEEELEVQEQEKGKAESVSPTNDVQEKARNVQSVAQGFNQFAAFTPHLASTHALHHHDSSSSSFAPTSFSSFAHLSIEELEAEKKRIDVLIQEKLEKNKQEEYQAITEYWHSLERVIGKSLNALIKDYEKYEYLFLRYANLIFENIPKKYIGSIPSGIFLNLLKHSNFTPIKFEDVDYLYSWKGIVEAYAITSRNEYFIYQLIKLWIENTKENVAPMMEKILSSLRIDLIEEKELERIQAESCPCGPCGTFEGMFQEKLINRKTLMPKPKSSALRIPVLHSILSEDVNMLIYSDTRKWKNEDWKALVKIRLNIDSNEFKANTVEFRYAVEQDKIIFDIHQFLYQRPLTVSGVYFGKEIRFETIKEFTGKERRLQFECHKAELEAFKVNDWVVLDIQIKRSMS